MKSLIKKTHTTRILRVILSVLFSAAVFVSPLNVAALIVNNIQFAAPPVVTGTCQYPDTMLWLYDTTDGENLQDYSCWDGVSKMIFDYRIDDSYTLIEMSPDGDCSDEDIAGCRNLPSYRGEASFTVGTTDIVGGSGGGGDEPVNPPGDAGPLWINHATYHPAQNIGAVCAAGGNYLALYDTTAGQQIGVFPCGTIPFNGTAGHSYTLLEISNGSVCNGLSYDTCANTGYGVAEITFSVSVSGGTDGGVSSPNAEISKSAYLSGEDVFMTCTFSHNSLGLFNTETGENLGVFPCGSPISFSGQDGLLYALVEITNASACNGQEYSTCVSSGYGVSETHFFVSATGDIPNDAPPGIPGTSKSAYKPGEAVLATCTFSGNSLVLYDVGTNDNLGVYACGSPIVFSGQDGHAYRLLEVTNPSACTDLGFDACYGSGYASLYYDFNVSTEKPVQGLKSYPPDISISSPKAGAVFSRRGIVSYRASDQNDRGSADERARLGLSASPVSLYYSDKISDWDHTLTPQEDMTLISDKQPASGTYQWDTSNLLPGVFYRIVATVTDAIGNVSEDVSEPFTVDFEQPSFTVTVDPPVARAQDVTITVLSSKDLKGTPTTTVTQQGGTQKVVTMKGIGKEFKGTYTIVPGHDGVAIVTVEGRDAVGNTGNTIVSGGTFAVGIDPPPTPRITSPTKSAIVASSTLTLTGTTRPDTFVVVKINGVVGASVKPDTAGKFSIPITLSAVSHRGLNTISVAAKDQAGITGAEASVEVKYNIAPVVHIAAPQDGSAVGSQVAIEATSSDANLDPLFYTYQLISKSDYEHGSNAFSATTSTSTLQSGGWITLAERVPSARFNWDSTEVDDGSYFVRIIADDGIERAVSDARLITIKNTLPYFRFEDGRKTVTGTSTAIIRGKVIVPTSISPRPVVWNAEYSLDDGKRWIPVRFTSGSSTPEATFAVMIPGLREGTQGMLWRARDSRSLVGKASHPVVFDTTPPKAPVLSAPKTGSLITDGDDSSPRKGMQISLVGRAEAGSLVTLSFASTTQQAKAGADGAFAFRDLDIPGKGAYGATLTATDPVGNTSAASRIDFTYDNPPTVAILQPKNMRALSGKSKIQWRVSDPDADPIVGVSLSFRTDTSAFVRLPVASATTSYDWDVSKLPEGRSYQLRLVAGDGIASSSNTIDFSIDRTAPSLNALAIDRAVLRGDEKLTGRGTAHDALAGIEYVEYSIVPEQSDAQASEWYTALITKGFLGKDATFTISHPVRLADGTYRLSVRAVDAAGNTSAAETRTLQVDSSPPRIGSFEFKNAGATIPPDEGGTITAFEHSAGAFSISLESDTREATLSMGDVQIPLTKEITTGLWSAALTTGARGTASLSISAQDEAGNTVEKRNIGSLASVARGRVTLNGNGGVIPLQGASVEVLVLDQRGMYVPFTSPDFQRDALVTDANGAYELALPEGSYRIVVRKNGYASVDRTLTRTGQGVVTESFQTRQLSGVGSLVQSVSEFFTP